MTKPMTHRLTSDAQFKADMREVANAAAQATNMLVDRVLAGLTDLATYPLPTESFASESALRAKLNELPAASKSKVSSDAIKRLSAPQAQRRTNYGDLAAVSMTKQTAPIAALMRTHSSEKLNNVRERVHKALNNADFTNQEPGFLSTPLHLIKDKIEKAKQSQLPGQQPKHQVQQQQHQNRLGQQQGQKQGARIEPKQNTNVSTSAAKPIKPIVDITDKLHTLDLTPLVKIRVPSEIELRLKKITCNRPTRGLGKDDIFIAARMSDYYNGSDIYTPPIKVGKFNENNSKAEFTPPLSLGTIPVADNLIFDSIFDATIYLAECDLGPRDFEKYVEGTASVSSHTLKEIIIAIYISTAIGYLVDESSQSDLSEDVPALLMVGNPGFLAATALGLLPPKWQFLVGAIIDLVPALVTGIICALYDITRGLFKDDIFPENIVHLHLDGPILLSTDSDERVIPAHIQNFELRQQRHSRSTVVVAQDAYQAESTRDQFEGNDPDIIASYTLELEWVIRTSEEDIPVSDLEPAKPLTDETEALKRLDENIDHIIVLMMENRSFDHMLGFLEHDRGRKDLDPTVTSDLPDGLPRFNQVADVRFEPFALDKSRFAFDPKHNVEQVGLQLFGAEFWKDGQPQADPPVPAWSTDHVFSSEVKTDDQIDFPLGSTAPTMSGFVESYTRVINGIRSSTDPGNSVDLSDSTSKDFEKDKTDVKQIMGYHPAENVPYYDFLATEFGVCNKWFCAFPGNTWINRNLAYTGKPAKFKREGNEEDTRLVADNAFPLDEVSFIRTLERKGKNWAWYSQDFPSLLCVDLSLSDQIPAGRIRSIDRFFKDLKEPATFPEVAWIDPNFMDIGDLGSDLRAAIRRVQELVRPGKSPGISSEMIEINTANSDQPPTDVMHGQAFIQMVVEKLMDSPVWNKCLLIITYDEHGGFYDHVPPERVDPSLQPDLPELSPFHWRGPRVPAFVVSPHVGRQLVFTQAPPDANNVQKVVDHLSIQKTILQRFCPEALDQSASPIPRVVAAEHLAWVLSGPNLRFPPNQALNASATRRRKVFNMAMHAVVQSQLAAAKIREQENSKLPRSDFYTTYLEKQKHVANRMKTRMPV